MASPVGHSLFGLVIAVTMYPRFAEKSRATYWVFLAVAVVLANTPDLDFVPGFIINDPGRFHHMATHSIISILLVTPLIALALQQWQRWPLDRTKSFLFVGLVLGSHALADYVTADGSAPYGMMALWPLRDDWYISPVIVLGPVIKGQVGTDIFSFFQAMWTPINIRTIGRELMIGGCLLFLALWLRIRRAKSWR